MQHMQTGHLRAMFDNVRRRHGWFTENATPRQFANLALAAAEYALKREAVRAWPVFVKIDISPLCNLRCTYCVHARPSGPGAAVLQEQSFNARQFMPLDRYRRIIREIGGKSMAVALYYLGDPLIHPDLDAMCSIARRARLNSHVSSNFSFKLSDDRLGSLVKSGLTHLTVCVDGLRQESYGRTRVGGSIDLVLDNLDRLLRIRTALGQRYPRVEVQYIMYQHNMDQIEDAATWCDARGVDQFTTYWGFLHNYADVNPGKYNVLAPKTAGLAPRCSWPHFALQIKYDGDVIPCCYYRNADQYRPKIDAHAVGNVYETSLRSIWNSPRYQRLRRLVSNPMRARSEAGMTGTFCDGCPVIFETDAVTQQAHADRHRWEDLYFIDERNIVTRR